jgi:hypothetical protein
LAFVTTVMLDAAIAAPAAVAGSPVIPRGDSANTFF